MAEGRTSRTTVTQLLQSMKSMKVWVELIGMLSVAVTVTSVWPHPSPPGKATSIVRTPDSAGIPSAAEMSVILETKVSLVQVKVSSTSELLL